MVKDMDLSPWAHGGVVEIRVAGTHDRRRLSRDRVHCILEIEYADGSTELLERRFGDEGFVLAAFEAFVRDLNRALQAKRRQ